MSNLTSFLFLINHIAATIDMIINGWLNETKLKVYLEPIICGISPLHTLFKQINKVILHTSILIWKYLLFLLLCRCGKLHGKFVTIDIYQDGYKTTIFYTAIIDLHCLHFEPALNQYFAYIPKQEIYGHIY